MVKIYNDILVDIDKKKAVILLVLDLSAAFYILDHEILLYRLATRFGLSDVALSWFRSYLCNRSQFVDVRAAQSVTHFLPCGVPQGYVLGPVLYRLNTSPLEDIARWYNLGFHFYADDTQLYLSFKIPSVRRTGFVALLRLSPVSVKLITGWLAISLS